MNPILTHNIVSGLNEDIRDIPEEIDVWMTEFRIVHENFERIT